MNMKRLHYLLSFIALLGLINPAKAQLTYCAAVNAGGAGSLINNVSFGSISNNTAGSNPTVSPFYTSFPASTTTTSVVAGSSVPLSITIDPSGTYVGAIASVWIDYDQDG